MYFREIKIFNIAETKANLAQIRGWLDYVGAKDYCIPTPHYDDSERDVSHAELVVGLAAKRCYNSFEPGLNPNVTRVRKDWTKFLDNILDSGHGSVLEHADRIYAIEGVTRVFTGEINRHRAGVAISEGSMRFIGFREIPFWCPQSLSTDDDFGIGDNLHPVDIETTKRSTLNVIRSCLQSIEEHYQKLLDLWQPEFDKFPMAAKKRLTSLFRRILPMGISTGGVWKFNLRALRHVIALRSSSHAEEEIAYVASLLAKDIVEKEPRLFGDFKQDDQGFWVPKYVKV
jgi:thymidylate synthase (FAD)